MLQHSHQAAFPPPYSYCPIHDCAAFRLQHSQPHASNAAIITQHSRLYWPCNTGSCSCIHAAACTLLHLQRGALIKLGMSLRIRPSLCSVLASLKDLKRMQTLVYTVIWEEIKADHKTIKTCRSVAEFKFLSKFEPCWSSGSHSQRLFQNAIEDLHCKINGQGQGAALRHSFGGLDKQVCRQNSPMKSDIRKTCRDLHWLDGLWHLKKDFLSNLPLKIIIHCVIDHPISILFSLREYMSNFCLSFLTWWDRNVIK